MHMNTGYCGAYRTPRYSSHLHLIQQSCSQSTFHQRRLIPKKTHGRHLEVDTNTNVDAFDTPEETKHSTVINRESTELCARVAPAACTVVNKTRYWLAQLDHSHLVSDCAEGEAEATTHDVRTYTVIFETFMLARSTSGEALNVHDAPP